MRACVGDKKLARRKRAEGERQEENHLAAGAALAFLGFLDLDFLALVFFAVFLAPAGCEREVMGQGRCNVSERVFVF